MSADIRNTESTELPRAIRIPAGSVTLEGEIHVPPGAEGVVLFAHGSGSGRHSPRNRFVAGRFRKAGIGTVLFDLFTAEEERADAARGHLRFNIGLLTQRLVCAAHWIAEEDEARHRRLGFFGSSTGGGALSTSIGAIFSPFDRTMISFSLPVMNTCPCSSMRAISPELSQPSSEMICRVASAFSQ